MPDLPTRDGTYEDGMRYRAGLKIDVPGTYNFFIKSRGMSQVSIGTEPGSLYLTHLAKVYYTDHYFKPYEYAIQRGSIHFDEPGVYWMEALQATGRHWWRYLSLGMTGPGGIEEIPIAPERFQVYPYLSGESGPKIVFPADRATYDAGSTVTVQIKRPEGVEPGPIELYFEDELKGTFGPEDEYLDLSLDRSGRFSRVWIRDPSKPLLQGVHAVDLKIFPRDGDGDDLHDHLELDTDPERFDSDGDCLGDGDELAFE